MNINNDENSQNKDKSSDIQEQIIKNQAENCDVAQATKIEVASETATQFKTEIETKTENEIEIETHTENEIKNETHTETKTETEDETDIEDETDDFAEASSGDIGFFGKVKRGYQESVFLQKLMHFVLFLILLAVAFSAGQIIKNKVFTLATVSQTSMHDTFTDGDTLYIMRIAVPDQFDIIVFQEDEISADWLVKRVIATEGQEVEIKNGILYITENGTTKVYREEYVNGENITLEKTLVPDGKLFVLGDNRSVSRDSEEFGFVDVSSMIGQVVFVDSEEAILIDTIKE